MPIVQKAMLPRSQNSSAKQPKRQKPLKKQNDERRRSGKKRTGRQLLRTIVDAL